MTPPLPAQNSEILVKDPRGGDSWYDGIVTVLPTATNRSLRVVVDIQGGELWDLPVSNWGKSILPAPKPAVHLDVLDDWISAS